jgi:hypothetical protein
VSKFGDLTHPADVPKRLWIELAAVIDREIPIAVWPLRARRARSARRHRLYGRQRNQAGGNAIGKVVCCHPPIVTP